MDMPQPHSLNNQAGKWIARKRILNAHHMDQSKGLWMEYFVVKIDGIFPSAKPIIF